MLASNTVQFEKIERKFVWRAGLTAASVQVAGRIVNHMSRGGAFGSKGPPMRTYTRSCIHVVITPVASARSRLKYKRSEHPSMTVLKLFTKVSCDRTIPRVGSARIGSGSLAVKFEGIAGAGSGIDVDLPNE